MGKLKRDEEEGVFVKNFFGSLGVAKREMKRDLVEGRPVRSLGGSMGRRCVVRYGGVKEGGG